jgi:hypothetical protein
MVTMIQESTAMSISGKDMYTTWLEMNALEEELESPEGAIDLLKAESYLVEYGGEI